MKFVLKKVVPPELAGNLIEPFDGGMHILDKRGIWVGQIFEIPDFVVAENSDLFDELISKGYFEPVARAASETAPPEEFEPESESKSQSESEKVKEEVAESSETEKPEPEEGYTQLTKKQIVAKLKELKIEFNPRNKKQELIKLLKKHED